MMCEMFEHNSVAKMRALIIVLMSVVSFASSERNIIPSPAVCATFSNEEFAVDLLRCQNTCEFYGRTQDCPDNYYRPNGDCYCKKGFARLTENGNCVSVTGDQACKAKLPITAAACTRPNEIFKLEVVTPACDLSCLTYGCLPEDRQSIDTDWRHKWAPNCDCKDDYRRLSNGTCVHLDEPQCKAEYKPSAARCSALGQIYKKNAPCQPTCSGDQYCPSADGACICPPNKKAYVYNGGYYSQKTYNLLPMISCYHENGCPFYTYAQA